jgi:Fe-S-cluster containining protein
MAVARLVRAALEQAKVTGSIDLPVRLYQSVITSTVDELLDIPIACRKGCSHCCHTWVSATAPEVLHIAKLIKERGGAVIENVRITHEQTKEYDFDTRAEHPHACPLLENDTCSIYKSRPMTCRLAASADAEICARTYHNITNEDVPTPMMYVVSRNSFAIAMAAGLRKAGLPDHAYELNAALARALETEDAERRWLAGEDIFSDVRRDPEGALSDPQAQHLYQHAFTD